MSVWNTDFSGTLRLLSAVYPRVCSLAELVESLPGALGGIVVQHNDDTEQYCTFISQLVVCVPEEAFPPQKDVSRQQLSTQKEVVARVIKRICETNTKNVLAFGYGLVDENSDFPLTMAPSICNYLPNTTTATISTSSLWETLLSRIGDDLMMYLLQVCSLFLLVPPTCCYQVCGQPIYTLPSNAQPAPALSRQRCSRFRRNILSKYICKTFQQKKMYFAKAKWRKEKQRLLNRTTLIPIQSKAHLISNCTNEETVVSAESQASTKTSIPMISKPKRHVKPILQERKHTFQPPKKHKDNFETPPPAKRLKSNLNEKSDASLCCLVDMSEPNLETTYHNSCIQFMKSHSSIKVQLKNPEEGEGKSTWQRESVNQKNHILSSNVYIERRSMLYSSRSCREGFPQSFLLNELMQDTSGGQRLVENIFLQSQLFEHDPTQRSASPSEKQKRLPQRYWKMKHLFQELLQNHKKCPYMVFLKKNCSVRLPPKLSETNVGVKNNTCGVLEQPVANKEKAFNEEMENIDERHKVFFASAYCGVQKNNTLSSLRKENDLANAGDADVCNLRVEERLPFHSSKETIDAQDKSLADSCFMLLSQHSRSWQVYAFVRKCVQHVVPEELWGSNQNKRRFMKNVKTFITLGKFEKFSLRQLMWKMRPKNCSWLRLKNGDHFVPASEHRFREGILAKFLYWLMDTYVKQLLRSFFYITETTFQKNMLFFFRKCIWSKLQSIGLGKHFAKVKLNALTSDQVKALWQKKQNRLTSKLRFIPKPCGLRPIVKVDDILSVQSHSRDKKEKKIQHLSTQLKNLFAVLNYERARIPNLLGSSVFGIDGAWKLWRQFVLKVLESNAEEKTYYFVKADVEGAYDSIPHAKLTEVISKIFDPKVEKNYCIRRYAEIWMDSTGRIRKSYKTHVSSLSDFNSSMTLFVSALQQNSSLKHAILIEQSLSLNESSRKLLNSFQETISNSILKVNERYYVQHCGIPQGSIISTLLCSLCYGDMENRLFCGIKDGMVMRLIDDFLLVTPHLNEAKHFIRTLAEGVPQYGCCISPQKTTVNFSLDDIPGCSEAEQLPAHCVFPWCGLLFNTQTLEVHCDYSRYACISIRSSLTLNHSAAAGMNMRQKLMMALKLKCNNLLMDLAVNGLQTVCLNMYKLFLLQAYRFHACVIQLPYNQGVRKNPSFFLNVISDMAPCLFYILKSTNKGVTVGDKDAYAPLPFEAAEWLNCHAFIAKLSCHKVVYKSLLRPLQNGKVYLSKKIPHKTMKILTDVTEPSFHQDFAGILI